MGVITGFAVALAIGAGQPARSYPKYQLTGLGDSLLVLDNDTNSVAVLFKKRGNGQIAPNWPWASDNTFNIQDAIEKPDGAIIRPGPGR